MILSQLIAAMHQGAADCDERTVNRLSLAVEIESLSDPMFLLLMQDEGDALELAVRDSIDSHLRYAETLNAIASAWCDRLQRIRERLTQPAPPPSEN